jgi:hypothetical protein
MALMRSLSGDAKVPQDVSVIVYGRRTFEIADGWGATTRQARQ